MNHQPTGGKLSHNSSPPPMAVLNCGIRSRTDRPNLVAQAIIAARRALVFAGSEVSCSAVASSRSGSSSRPPSMSWSSSSSRSSMSSSSPSTTAGITSVTSCGRARRRSNLLPGRD
ncbi:hypothetical protein [Mycolicibacterium mageritense]|uniref:hypothetical protein n=1 Tax=Mycolicibacterium mageritense TaxID=53462 RepID=UPI001E31A154|nr:hypothetical protein [Mycolicibacterium mageritense]MCC9185188.1 hypothetical protein [Mycolicibacterium mageritense]